MGVHDGHRNRLRERFLQEGLDSFQPHNVLELILFYAIPRKDTNELAHALLDRFGTFSAVLDAPVEELCKVKGISYSSAVLIKSFMPVARYYTASKGNDEMILDSVEKCGDYLLSHFAGLLAEKTVLLCMDSRCKLLSCVDLAEGDICSVGLSSRRLAEAVINSGATCVVMAHNHPSGVAIPSRSDIEATHRAAELVKTIGATLADHIIVANDDYVSMLQSAEYSHIFSR